MIRIILTIRRNRKIKLKTSCLQAVRQLKRKKRNTQQILIVEIQKIENKKKDNQIK